MHSGAKWTLIIGGVVLAISMVAMFAGGAVLIDDVMEAPNAHWDGTAPTTEEIELSEASIHRVFIADGSDVTVHPVDAGVRFILCEDGTGCDSSSMKNMTYLGDLEVDQGGWYNIEFRGSGQVSVTENEIDVGSALTAFAGFCGACLGALLLLIGLILALTKKDTPSTSLLVIDPTTGQVVQTQSVNPMPVQAPENPAETYSPILGSQPAFEEPGPPPQGGSI